MKLIAIDPGTTQSAYVIMDGYHPDECGLIANDALAGLIRTRALGLSCMAIECMESRHVITGDGGAGVIGRETYETAEWIGRFKQIAEDRGLHVDSIFRSQELKNIIPSKRNKLPPLPENAPKTHDGKIKMALCMRFAPNDIAGYGKGTAKAPGWFYGFKADIWQAYAVGVTWMDTVGGGKT